MRFPRRTVGSRPALAGLLAGVLALASCGIPPYSSVREIDVRGVYTLKVRGAVHEDLDLTDQDFQGGRDDIVEPLDHLSSWGLELERQLGEQWTASFAIEARQYEPQGGYSNIRANQLRASFRRYFGDRALTAFLAGDLIYGMGMRFNESMAESEDWLGWGAGGGVNLAVSEDFSIDAYVMYESMAEAEVYPAPGAAPNSNIGFKGIVAYIALGWHF